MLKRVLKGVGLLVAVVVVLIGIAALLVPVLADRKMARVVPVDPAPVAPATAPEALARGKYLFETRGCADCHGDNGAGHRVIDDPKTGMLVFAPNITPGGVVAKYTAQDWVRAIRHGLKPNRTPVIVMPSEDYNRLSDEDLAALVGYARTLPAASGGDARIELPLVVKALYAVGFVKDSAEKIDHGLPPAQPVAPKADPEHGRYVAYMCTGCHGPGFAGGRVPGSPPDWPPASNLTPGEGTVLARYDTVDKFKAMMRTGRRPDGSAVSTVMPFPSLKRINDVELEAMYAFFRTLPPKAAGTR